MGPLTDSPPFSGETGWELLIQRVPALDQATATRAVRQVGELAGNLEEVRRGPDDTGKQAGRKVARRQGMRKFHIPDTCKEGDRAAGADGRWGQNQVRPPGTDPFS